MNTTQTASRRWIWLLGALPLASGAALIIHILWNFSLGLALLALGIGVILIAFLVWQRLSPKARLIVAKRFKVGLVAGLLGVLAYDGLRWIIITVFHTTFQPFDIFPAFGMAIANSGMPGPLATIVGILYHFTNGLMFAASYTILFGQRGWWAGILWALGLEALMLYFYSMWRPINAPNVYSEFVTVSMLGHIAYGAVLGSASQLILRRMRTQ